jgi:hypothetical protein
MAEIVTTPHEVSINGVRYKLAGDVQRSLSSNYPEKTVIGDYTKDSSPVLSTLSLSDHRGGIGLDTMTGNGDIDRSWYSTADTRFLGHLILPPLVTTTGSLPAGATAFGVLAEYVQEMYCDFDATSDGFYKYNNTTDAWSALLDAAVANTSRSSVVGSLGGTYYIVFAGTDGYTYFDGTTWANGSRDVRNVAIWNDRLWGTDLTTGYLWYTYTPGSGETNDALLPVGATANKVNGLFVGRDTNGQDILYLSTPEGLFAHDPDNARFMTTGMRPT